MFKLQSFLLFILFSFSAFSQLMEDVVFDDNIKTVEFYRSGWSFSYPHLNLGTNGKLLLSFDEAGAESKQYNYKIIHCNADWTVSRLFVNEYLEGFEINSITDYDNGFNVVFDYVNYQLEIPNQDVQIKMSGNYILQVVDELDENKVVLQKRFWVSEEIVDMSLRVRRPLDINYVDEGQELELKIQHSRLDIPEPFSDLYVEIRQNNRQEERLAGIKPVFVHDYELIYTFNEKMILHGCNEFRNLNIYNLKYNSEDVDSIWFDGRYNRIRLFLDQYRSNKPYFYNEDFNGRFYITNQDGSQSKREGDYAKVQFSLDCKLPFSYGRVYLYGSFTNWSLSEKYEMVYDYEQQMYNAEILLKQGYYDYAYVFVEGEKTYPSFAEIEGNFSETENDYVVLVYYHDRQLNSDRLVGISVVNYKY